MSCQLAPGSYLNAGCYPGDDYLSDLLAADYFAVPDVSAIALYDKLGQRESVLHFDIPVNETQAQ